MFLFETEYKKMVSMHLSIFLNTNLQSEHDGSLLIYKAKI